MGLSPKTFWSMSLTEWRAAVSGRTPKRSTPMNRSELTQLMHTHPDES
jgi:hypothetical protein